MRTGEPPQHITGALGGEVVLPHTRGGGEPVDEQQRESLIRITLGPDVDMRGPARVGGRVEPLGPQPLPIHASVGGDPGDPRISGGQ